MNTFFLGLASFLLTVLIGLTIWSLREIITVRTSCGGCKVEIKNIDKKQTSLERRQDVLEANHGDLAVEVGKIDQRVRTLEDKI